MGFDWDISQILYMVGVLFGVTSLIYFGRELILKLSPVIKSAVLFLIFGGFFAGAEYIPDRSTSKFLYLISASSYIVSFVYSVSKFNCTAEQIFFGLLISSVLFMGLGYLKGEGNELRKKNLKAALILITAAIIILLSFDIIGPRPNTNLELKETINTTNRIEIDLGKLKVSNNFLFTRNFEKPNYGACVHTPEERDLWVDVERKKGEQDTIKGNKKLNLNLQLNIPPRRKEDFEELGVLEVKKVEDCPEESQPGNLFVFKRGRPD